MFWSLINRTIFWDLVKIFCLSMISITGILVLAVVVMEAQSRGLGPFQIVAIIPLVIPSTFPYTVPATTLFATCIVYGRLAADNEILAIKAAGINVLHVVWPAVFLGVVTSIATAGMYYQVIPKTYHRMKTLFLNDVESLLYGMLKQQGRVVHPKLDYVLYVKRVQGRKLVRALFMHKVEGGQKYDVVAQAREAELIVNTHKKVVLVHMKACQISTLDSGGNTIVEDQVFQVHFPQDFTADRQNRRSDMDWKELFERKDELKTKIEDVELRIAEKTALHSLKQAPDALDRELLPLLNEQHMYQQYLRDVDAEIHRRPALAFGCFFFVLVGCPVGIWFSRSDYLSAFVTCFLPIIIVYYPLLLCGENLARAGTVDPAMAIWSANIVLGVAGVILYWRLLRH